MRLGLICLLAFLVSMMIGFAANFGSKTMANFRQGDEFTNWKEIWSDGFELHLVRLPGYIHERKLYELKNRKFESIGYRILSPDNKKVVFTSGNFGSKNPSDNLYILDIEKGNLEKIGHCSSGIINLRGFLDNNRLLLVGYLKIEGDLVFYHEKVPDNSGYFYIYDLRNHQLELLDNLGSVTVGMANAICSQRGSSFAYETRDGFVVYNVDKKRIVRINKKGDLIAISPEGQKILFKSNNGYSCIDIDGGNEELVLSKREINKVTPIFNGYFELRFVSWSPDGRYILFGESSDQNKGRGFILDLETKQLGRQT